MKKKICVFVLVMSLLLSQSVAVFAENMDNYNGENEFIDEQISDVIEKTDGLVEEENGILEGTDSIVQSNDMDNEQSIDDEEVVKSNDDSTLKSDSTLLENEKSVIASMQMLEAGDSVSTATNISTGMTYSGSITSTNSEDYYKFVIDSSGRITLTATAEMSWIYYYIYDSNGNQLWTINPSWNSTTELISTSEIIDLTKGTYYFVVKQDGTKTGNYSFKLGFNSSGESFTETESGSNNAINCANTINVNSNYNGQLAINDDKDFYKFTLSSSGRIVISATAKMRWIYYYVYDSSGNQLWNINPSWNSTTETIATSEIVDLTKGTYYLAVSRDGNYTGNYSFKLGYTSANESFTETEFGSNNTLDSANSISLNTSYNGQLAINDEKDFYKFKLGSATKIYFTATAKMKWIYYHIYDSNGNQLWSKNPSWNSTTEKIDSSETFDLSAGTYYFVFEKDGSYTGPYTFKIATNSGVVSKPKKVTLKKTSNDSQGNIKVNWEKVKDAKGYRIYKKDKNGDYKKVADVASDKTSYIDKSGSIGSKYTYTVRAYKKSGDQYILGDYDKNGVNGQKIPAKVILATIKNNSKGQVNLTWEKVSGIDGYRVYRKASGEGWKKLKDMTATSITDTSAKIGVTYSYTVRAYKKINGNLVQGSYDSKGFSGKRVPPTVQLVSAKYQKDKGVVVNWKKTDDCSGYVIYRKDTKSGWTRLAKVSGKDNVKYTDKVRSNINTYKYTVRAYQTVNAKEILGGYDKSGVSVTK